MCLLLHAHIAQESCAPDFGPQLSDVIYGLSEQEIKTFLTPYYFKEPC